jgi:hypothetical protein
MGDENKYGWKSDLAYRFSKHGPELEIPVFIKIRASDVGDPGSFFQALCV